MSKKNTFSALFAICALCASCSDDSSSQYASAQIPEGSACTSSDSCTAPEVCTNGQCVKPDDSSGNIEEKPDPANPKPDGSCGGKTCGETEVCYKDDCYVFGNYFCGTSFCFPNEFCYEDACLPIPDDGKCGDTACNDSQICVNGVCHEPGGCGGAACLDGETCIAGSCRTQGNCGGYRCNIDEMCDYGTRTCRKRGDCDGFACLDSEYCDGYCKQRSACGDILCEGNDVCIDGECQPNSICIGGKARCGEVCCTDNEFCGQRQKCCSFEEEVCGRDCCQDGEVCINERCRKDCGEHTRCTDENGADMCCEDGEICTSNQCFKPLNVTCVDSYMCDNGQYCDTSIHQCMPNPKGEVCKAEPKGGQVQPTLLWYWGKTPPAAFPNHIQVMSSPMVADMNNDGTPEVVFNAFSGSGYQGNGILRILNGKTGDLIASSDGSPFTDGGSQVALGDLDGDTIPEIVTCSASYRLIAYKYNPTNNTIVQMWSSASTIQECGQGGPGIADFNGDGSPEVYVRYSVHNGKTGEMIGQAKCEDAGGNYDARTAHAPCDYNTAADIDGDGQLELVGGAKAYKIDFENKMLINVYDRTKAGTADGFKTAHREGYPAIADLNLDGLPEIAVIQSNSNSVMAFNADGSDYWKAPLIHTAAAGGPPTIANIDDTPEPEITFAGKYAYVSIGHDGTIKWTRTTRDYSSAKTGSSVFDFDGDGKAEIIYADEYFLRVYDGETGDTRYCQCNTSGTHWEYPVIADVNADEHAEIIVSSNNSMIPNCPTSLAESEGFDACVEVILKSANPEDRAGTHGVRVFSSPDQDWVNTRRIYNQHAYSITNVSDNASIPAKQRTNWTVQGLNNFRLNVQPGASFLPNLRIDAVSSPMNCQNTIPVYFSVVNDGWAIAAAGVPIFIWYSADDSSTPIQLAEIKTANTIGAGQSESMRFDFTPLPDTRAPYTLTFTFGKDGAPIMCRTDDKQTNYTISCGVN